LGAFGEDHEDGLSNVLREGAIAHAASGGSVNEVEITLGKLVEGGCIARVGEAGEEVLVRGRGHLEWKCTFEGQR
jgi:hypothetical protein